MGERESDSRQRPPAAIFQKHFRSCNNAICERSPVRVSREVESGARASLRTNVAGASPTSSRYTSNSIRRVVLVLLLQYQVCGSPTRQPRSIFESNYSPRGGSSFHTTTLQHSCRISAIENPFQSHPTSTRRQHILVTIVAHITHATYTSETRLGEMPRELYRGVQLEGIWGAHFFSKPFLTHSWN